MRQCLAAHTSTKLENPDFINITRVDHGYVEIIIRGKDGKDDSVAMITLSATDFNAFIGELLVK